MNASDVAEIVNIRNRSTISLTEARDKYQIFQDVLSISSGTFATLTGYRKYTDLDTVRNDFITFTRITIPRSRYSNWMDAWKAYMRRNNENYGSK